MNAPVVEWEGAAWARPLSTSLNNGAYDYRTFTTFLVFAQPSYLALHWRHLPSAIDATQAAINSSINARSLQPAGTLSTSLGAESSYDVFDLSGGFNVGKRTQLRYGIDNLFDTPPVCTGGRTRFRTRIQRRAVARRKPASTTFLGRSVYVGVKVGF